MLRARGLLVTGFAGFAMSLMACGSRTGEELPLPALDGGAVAPEGAASSSSGGNVIDVTPVFPTGVYACGSTLSAAGSYEGESYEAVAGGNGVLTVTQSGAVVTAAYAGNLFVTGTLRFVATTDSSAEPAAAGQTLTVQCPAPFAGPVQQTMSVASGSLTMDGATLFLSFSGPAIPNGAGASACDGVTIPGTLTCSTEQ